MSVKIIFFNQSLQNVETKSNPNMLIDLVFNLDIKPGPHKDRDVHSCLVSFQLFFLESTIYSFKHCATFLLSHNYIFSIHHL